MIKDIKHFSAEAVKVQKLNQAGVISKRHKSKRISPKDKVSFSKNLPPYEMAEPGNLRSYFAEAVKSSKSFDSLAELPKATAFHQLEKRNGIL